MASPLASLLLLLAIALVRAEIFTGEVLEGAFPNIFEQADDAGSEEAEAEEEAVILPVSKPLGEISGLGIDSKGRLIAFHRADRQWNLESFTEKGVLNKSLAAIVNSTIALIDLVTGQVLEEHGENEFFMPHGLSVDKNDNVWVTDVGRHQVIKLDKSFKPVLTVGEKMVPGSDSKHLCMPTDVAVASNGHFFVADGYCNNRVLKFDEKGNLLDVFGAPEVLSGEGFVVPHSLALVEDLDMICVADRENERVLCFSAGLAAGHRAIPAGILITNAQNIGRVYGIREKRHYLVGVTDGDMEGQLEPQLFAMDIESGKAKTFVKGIENGHALAISDDGVVYVAQMHPNQIIALPLKA